MLRDDLAASRVKVEKRGVSGALQPRPEHDPTPRIPTASNGWQRQANASPADLEVYVARTVG